MPVRNSNNRMQLAGYSGSVPWVQVVLSESLRLETESAVLTVAGIVYSTPIKPSSQV